MVQVKPADKRDITEEGDFLQIKAIDHIHFYVGNAKQAMYYWWKGFGFAPIAYSGLETGNREFASYVLQSGKIRIVVSAPYSPNSSMAGHHMLHGDGVKSVALQVGYVDRAHEVTTERGAVSAQNPYEEKDEFGYYRTSAIHTYGSKRPQKLERQWLFPGSSTPTTSRSPPTSSSVHSAWHAPPLVDNGGKYARNSCSDSGTRGLF